MNFLKQAWRDLSEFWSEVWSLFLPDTTEPNPAVLALEKQLNEANELLDKTLRERYALEAQLAERNAQLAEQGGRMVSLVDRWRVALELEHGRYVDALDALYNAINQACWREEIKAFDSMGLSDYESALHLLAEAGRVKIVDENRVIAVPVEPQAEAKDGAV